MAEYKILFDRDVEKDLGRIPKKIAINILKKAHNLCGNPRPPQSLKLTGTEGTYRLRVGDYRIIYCIDDTAHLVTVYHVRNRRDVYRNL